MFFFFSKALQFLIHPVNWLIVGIAIGLFSKNEKRRRRFLIGTLVLFLTLTNNGVHDAFCAWWEVPLTPIEELEKHDVAVILGGYSRPSLTPRDRLHLANSPNRFANAIQLYSMGKVKKILLTGGSAIIIGERVCESEIVAKYLSDFGVDPEDILIENKSRNTFENAKYSLELIEEEGLNSNRCLLITSAFHMPRAKRCFDKVGFTVTPFSTDRLGDDIKANKLKYLRPSSEVLYHWDILVKEIVGLVAYRMRGYI